jgi:bifunctional non-homologous end joining protein LigD
MLASPGTLPDPEDGSWAYEVKWDGMRALATCARGRLRLSTRSGMDATSRFPEIAGAAPRALPEGSVIDGEVVAFDESGHPSFSLLAPRIQRVHGGSPTIGSLTYVVFDLLRLGAEDVVDRSYDERRRLLRETVSTNARVVVPDAFDDGVALFATTAAQHLEGVVAKRRDSRYQPGTRSPDWVKIPHRRTRSMLIGGWRSRAESPVRLSSLLLGAPTDDGMLRYEGAVGSGITDAETRALTDVLGDIGRATTPFHGYPAPEHRSGDVLRWVEPLLVVDVDHLGRTANGLLRQPTVVRLRPDLSCADVINGDGS